MFTHRILLKELFSLMTRFDAVTTADFNSITWFSLIFVICQPFSAEYKNCGPVNQHKSELKSFEVAVLVLTSAGFKFPGT